MSLTKYKKKRVFSKTPEPEGKMRKTKKKALTFVIQEHHASHLHYDFRLEMEGVLKSWAVPKGPSMNPTDKRLAVMTEDHPFEYGKFHGIIPEGNYGAGKVYIWDHGTYAPFGGEKLSQKEQEKILLQQLKKGHLHFFLKGKKLKGEFDLIQMKKIEKNWLLIKKDEQTKPKKLIRDSNGMARQKGKTSQAKNVFPKKISPMLSTLISQPFDREGWIFEIKWDGYRTLALLNNAAVQLLSRHNLSFNKKFPPIVESLQHLQHDVIFDGEIVAIDKEGRAHFQLLQNFQKTGHGNLVYYVFDVLYLDGKDVRTLPLIERKKILNNLFPISSHIKQSEYVETRGKDFYAVAKEHGIEGIMAKKASSTYKEGIRTRDWLKIKLLNQQEAVIAGITQPRGTRKDFGALVLGLYEKGEFVYIGHTGTGFDEKKLASVKKKLTPFFTNTSPFKKIPKTNAPVQWVKPTFVCEIRFANWTDDGYMREPVFLGIREDKTPKEVKREVPIKVTENIIKKNIVKNEHEKKPLQDARKAPTPGSSPNTRLRKNFTPPSKKTALQKSDKLQLSNLNKVYWPKEKYTKGDLIKYYKKVAPFLLPHLKDRPLTLHRHPDGIQGKSFFQKDLVNPPKGITTAKIYSESEEKHINWLICNDIKTLQYMANLGCIEINSWNSRLNHLDYPDSIVFDLDPLNVDFDQVIEAALTFHKVLKKIGIESYCKTSGATGLHIFVPAGAKYTTDQVIQFAKIVVHLVHKELPKTTSIERVPSKRGKKVYLDYLQNRYAQTMASVYSVRPRPKAPVSTPLRWSEVKKGLDPTSFTIKTIIKRLDKIGDIWKGVLRKGINMEKALKNIEKKFPS